MRYELIKTQNYLLVVSDEKIKDCYYFNELDKEVRKNNNENFSYHKKVICHKPLNGSPYLEGVDVLPKIEDDAEKVSIAEAEKLHDKDKHDDWSIYHQLIDEDARLIKLGYNKAREKYKYTDKDVEKAFNTGCEMLDSDKRYNETLDALKESLRQEKLPIAFESEVEKYGIGKTIHIKSEKYKYHSVVPKSIINTNGQTEWVGTYIY